MHGSHALKHTQMFLFTSLKPSELCATLAIIITDILLTDTKPQFV